MPLSILYVSLHSSVDLSMCLHIVRIALIYNSFCIYAPTFLTFISTLIIIRMYAKADGGEVFPLRMQANDPTSANRGFLEVNMSLQVAEFGFPPSVSPVPPQPVLNLHVHQAKGLAAADDNGASDPYAVVYFNDEEVWS